MAFRFRSGVAGSVQMSAAAFPSIGHRMEVYGEDGVLILENPTPDYMRGFRLKVATGDLCRCAANIGLPH